MNWLDVLIVVCLMIAVVNGIRQGLVKSVLSLLGAIVGLILAANYYEQLGGVLAFITNIKLANIVAFLIILAAVMSIALIISHIIRSVIKAIMLEWVDRIGGGFFGLVLGFLSVAGLLAVTIKVTGTGLISDSAVASFLLDKFPIVLGILPSEFKTIRDFFR